MRKLNLSLVFVLATGSTLMNASTLNESLIKSVIIENTNNNKVNFSNKDILEKAKSECVYNNLKDLSISKELIPGCTDFGGEVFASAIESGMSYEDSWSLGVAMMNVCNALVLLGSYL
jgi:hypothetical protein